MDNVLEQHCASHQPRGIFRSKVIEYTGLAAMSMAGLLNQAAGQDDPIAESSERQPVPEEVIPIEAEESNTKVDPAAVLQILERLESIESAVHDDTERLMETIERQQDRMDTMQEEIKRLDTELHDKWQKEDEEEALLVNQIKDNWDILGWVGGGLTAAVLVLMNRWKRKRQIERREAKTVVGRTLMYLHQKDSKKAEMELCSRSVEDVHTLESLMVKHPSLVEEVLASAHAVDGNNLWVPDWCDRLRQKIPEELRRFVPFERVSPQEDPLLELPEKHADEILSVARRFVSAIGHKAEIEHAMGMPTVEKEVIIAWAWEQEPRESRMRDMRIFYVFKDQLEKLAEYESDVTITPENHTVQFRLDLIRHIARRYLIERTKISHGTSQIFTECKIRMSCDNDFLDKMKNGFDDRDAVHLSIELPSEHEAL